MAKKKSDRKNKNFGDAVGISNIISSRQADYILGGILAVASIFSIIAMFSFLKTCGADQSILEHLRPGEWLNEKRAFENTCGSFGAILSYFLITKNFGYPAFLIPLFFLFVSGKMFRFYTANLWKWFFVTFFTMVWTSVALTEILTPFMHDNIFNPGGQHGIACVTFIENVMGTPGLVAILFFTALAFLTFVSTETITWFVETFNPVKAISKTIKNGIGSNTTNETAPQRVNDGIQNIKPEDDTNNNETSTTSSPDEAESTVIDLTNFSDLKEKKGNAKNNKPTEPQKGAQQSSNLTIETGKTDEKATGNTVAEESDMGAPINPREPFTKYKCPTLDLLGKDDNDGKPYVDIEEIKSHNEEIVKVLKSFGIEIREIKATVGPTITLYEITPAEGIRITKIRNLEDDIALRLSALGVRIIAPIPGKGTIGIEVPNKKRHNVSMESILNSKKFQDTKFDLPIVLGKTITNEVFMADLTKIPHLLVAGATGQGKSVGLNVIITSLLYKKHPNELKLVLIDPKKVEFSVYAPIADHFMAQVDDDDEPIITDVTKVVRTLKSLCTLMDHRYDLLKLAGARNIKEYNDKYIHHRLDPRNGHDFMPYIVVIIDEFGDLIMTAGKEVEMPIARIAQLARAVGIHMIIATQRPTTSIITGNIKANFPGRIAFKVSSMMDSRIILDRPGANQLIGLGDMLYSNGNEPTRVQCAFISTPEILSINKYIADQPGPVEPMELPEPKSDDGGDGNGGNGGGNDIGSLDPFFEEAARSVIISQQGSTSMIQRRFSIGYNRAGRLMDQLEKAGIVGAAHGSKPRDVLVANESQLTNIMNALRMK